MPTPADIRDRLQPGLLDRLTDVQASGPLGGLKLSIDDCVARDPMVLERLQALSVPAVFVGGGGYGRDSAKVMVASIGNLYKH